MIDLKKGVVELLSGEDEVDVNLKAYIHLSALFIPSFLKQKEAAIINISSGLEFIPLALFPVYCATKAAIHSFSLSLRHQLKDTSVRVFEVIPPTTDTELDHGSREKRDMERGIPATEVAKAAMDGLEKDIYEIPVGQAANLRLGSRTNPDELFNRMNH